MKKNNNRKGFTTVELVIVIAVIAILATVLIPTFSNLITKANESKALQEAKNAYTNYMVEHATTVTSETIYIQTGKTAPYVYFEAENGQLAQDPIADSDRVPCYDTIKYDATAAVGFTVVDEGDDCVEDEDGNACKNCGVAMP